MEKKLKGIPQTSEINPVIISGNKITVLQIFFYNWCQKTFRQLKGGKSKSGKRDL